MNENREALNYLASITSIGLASLAFTIPQQSEAQAVINWSMAERTVRVENREFKDELYNGERHWMIQGPEGEPGLYGGVASVPLNQINPADGYEVTLDGCESISSAASICDLDGDGDVDRGDIMAIYRQRGKVVAPGDLGDVDRNGILNTRDAKQCNIHRVAGAGQYQWRVDGELVQADPSQCKTVVSLPEGPHDVAMQVEYPGETLSKEETITVKDYLIVIMGDSYTSGEGNATRYADVDDDSYEDTLGNNGAGWSEGGYWDHANCHRSGRSGQANAVIDFERADPHSSVTTVFLACSGAQIDSGILGVKDGYIGGAEKPQTYLAHKIAKDSGRSVDAVILGIGGNDIGFVPVVAEGVVQEDVFLSTQLSPLNILAPDLPVTDDSPIDPDLLENLVLKPNPDFSESSPLVPYKTLEAATLHSCDSQFQLATLGEGGLGPEQSCRESIGTTEFGLAQVHTCLTGAGENDCQFARSYYTFPDEENGIEGGWKYAEGADVGIGDTWQGLGVKPSHVFYTEYIDLTSKFKRGSGEGDVPERYEYCSISLTKLQLNLLLEALKNFVDNPALIDALIATINASTLGEFGLSQSEFKWAADVVLNGFDEFDSMPPLLPKPKERIVQFDLTGKWRVNTVNPSPPPAAKKITIGGKEDVDFINLGNDAPALNEMTLLANALYGWTSVVGAFDAGSGHGLCEPQPTSNEDVATSGYAYLVGPNVSGSAHPNMAGQQDAIRPPLFEQLRETLLSLD